MAMKDKVEGQPLQLTLVDRNPRQPAQFLVELPSEEVKQVWIKELRALLDMQGDFLRADYRIVDGYATLPRRPKRIRHSTSTMHKSIDTMDPWVPMSKSALCGVKWASRPTVQSTENVLDPWVPRSKDDLNIRTIRSRLSSDPCGWSSNTSLSPWLDGRPPDWLVMKKTKALQSPIAYQKELTKESHSNNYEFAPFSSSLATATTSSTPSSSPSPLATDSSPIATASSSTKNSISLDAGVVTDDIYRRTSATSSQSSATGGALAVPMATISASSSVDDVFEPALARPRQNKPVVTARCQSVPTPMMLSLQNSQYPQNSSQYPYSSPDSACSTPTSGNSKLTKSYSERKPNSLTKKSPGVKRNILDGFRTLTRRSKSDQPLKNTQKGARSESFDASDPRYDPSYSVPYETQTLGRNSMQYRPSYNVQHFQPLSIYSPPDQPPPRLPPPTQGSTVRAIVDYAALKEDEISVSKNDEFQILSISNHSNQYLVHRPANEHSPAAEGWIPGHVIGQFIDREATPTSQRKGSWGGRLFKKQTSMKESKLPKPVKPSGKRDSWFGGTLERQKTKDKSKPVDGEIPQFLDALNDLIVQAGDTATLTCTVLGTPTPKLVWQHPDGTLICPTPECEMHYDEEEGTSTVQIHRCTAGHSGTYTVIASNEVGTVSSTAILTCIDKPGPPSKAVVKEYNATSVLLEWLAPQSDGNALIQGYTVEYLDDQEGIWMVADPYVPSLSQAIQDLTPGSVYKFRVSANNSVGISDPSLPTSPIQLPLASDDVFEDDPCMPHWKFTFDEDFSEIQEIARGRFALVKKVSDTISGQEFSAKFISKKLSSKDRVEIEYCTTMSVQHDNLLPVLALYESNQSYILIHDFLPLGRLFDYLSMKTSYDEVTVAGYFYQLLDVIQYLHNCRIAHLDVKPENLMVESDLTPRLKLIDFGDACHIYNEYYVHKLVGSAEFCAPELVNGTPVCLKTDVWSIGVVLYVLLSGVSPFLDESTEETCSNICRQDYCFPDEYFAGISADAKLLISSMLLLDASVRPSCQSCLDSSWLHRCLDDPQQTISHVTADNRPISAENRHVTAVNRPISTSRLRDFIQRRRHQSDASVICDDIIYTCSANNVNTNR